MRYQDWIGVVLLLGITSASEQDPKSKPQPPSAEVLQRANELSRPTDAHARLQRLVGSWTITLQNHVPGGEVQRDRGSVVGQAMLGGRYVALNYQLQMRGRAFAAVQILGFDALGSAYTSSWRDDRSTWSVDCRGEPNTTEPDMLALSGSLRDAQTPDGRPFRLELDLRTPERVTLRIFERTGEQETLLQQQQWRR